MARIFFMRWAVAVGACGVLLLPVEAQSAAATNLLRRGEATSGTTDATATVSSCGIPEVRSE